MDIEVAKDEFAKRLARIQGVVERKSDPILSNVLLHVRNGALRLTGTDLDIAVTTEVAADVREAGEIAVEASSLYQVIKSLPEARVRLVVVDKRLLVSSGSSKFKLPTLAAKDFPCLPAFTANAVAQVKSGDLLRVLEQTSYAVARGDERTGLNGLHVEVQGASLRLVATDGHRLAYSECAFDGDAKPVARTLIPLKAAKTLAKLLDASDSLVGLSFGDNSMRVSQEGQTTWFRLLDGEFPEYHAILPHSSRHTLTLSREELLLALRRIGVCAKPNTATRFGFERDALVLCATSESGEARESLPATLDGDALEVGFNIDYVEETIKSLDCEFIQIQTNSAIAPAMVCGTSAGESMSVVMPMRLG
jgi:DNA polymerase-3 subunit beta